MGDALTQHSVALQFVLNSFGGGSPFPSSDAHAAFLAFFVGREAAASAPTAAPVAAAFPASAADTLRTRFAIAAVPPSAPGRNGGKECASEKS